MTIYSVDADYHYFYLARFDASPIPDPNGTPGELIEVAHMASGLFIFTAARMATVTVSIQLLDRAPEMSLSDAVTDWRRGAEAALAVTEGLFLHAGGAVEDSGPHEPVVVPSRPGPHIVRVLGRARTDRDAAEAPTEEFQVMLWPSSD